MTEEYLTDDEQLEHAKQLAREYGPWTIGAIVIGIGLAYGWRTYQSHENQVAMDAATQFADMTAAVQGNNSARARQAAEQLIKAHPGSPYADQAQLALARLSIDEGQNGAAVGPLTEVMEHSKDSVLQHIARVRLARVLIDQGKPDDAIKTLSDSPGAFDAAYHEVRGDAYFAKKDPVKAGEEYRAALVEAGAGGDMASAVLTLKIADLGASAAPPAPAAAAAPASIAPPAAAASAAPDSSNKAKP
jgi:predicted negative regulator of RcsB-dependent stress response